MPIYIRWYSPSHSLFVIDPTKKSHEIIQGLKTLNWYRQNPAVDLLTAAAANKMAKNSLFVVGRNIYQAACGSSASAAVFIDNFMSKTLGYEPERRKAVLDGMLFEIFFNSKGELRTSVKGRYFNQAFELQKYSQLQDSFDFIAEALTAAGGDFYAVPGKGHEVAVTVSTKKKKDGTFVEAIYIDGVDVLRSKADAWDFADGVQQHAEIEPETLNERLVKELVVPARSLKVTYTPGSSALAETLYIPRGWTVRKGQIDDWTSS